MLFRMKMEPLNMGSFNIDKFGADIEKSGDRMHGADNNDTGNFKQDEDALDIAAFFPEDKHQMGQLSDFGNSDINSLAMTDFTLHQR